MNFKMPSSWLSRPIDIVLVGAGGTGSQLLTGLARLHIALRSLGHPYGLQVSTWDADNISPANIGRQLFSRGDIGRNKAIVLTHRLNAYFGLSWDAKAEKFGASSFRVPDLVITCVDTASARREIAKVLMPKHGYRAPLWLDCGNSQKSGQVMLGSLDGKDLPAMRQLLPEIFDASIPEDNRPSCSLAEALESQDLFINQAVATYAGHLLWSLMREGELDVCGYWINLEEGRTSPVHLSGVKPLKKAGRK